MNRSLIYCIITLLLASCEKDPLSSLTPDQETEGNITIGVNSGLQTIEAAFDGQEAIATRGIYNGSDINADWNVFDVRYIMEIWSNTTPRKLVLRKAVYTESLQTTVQFNNVRLLNNQTYDFFFWADLVDRGVRDTDGRSTDKYYNTQHVYGLQYVQIKTPYTGNTPGRDGFSARIQGKKLSELPPITLTRPFAKIVWQYTGLSSNVNSKTYRIRYLSGIYQTYNVATQEPVPGTDFPVDYSTLPLSDFEVEGPGTQTLITDYIFLPNTGTASIEMVIQDISNPNSLKTRHVQNVAARRNAVTVIKGAVNKAPYLLGAVVNEATTKGVIGWVNDYGTEAIVMSRKQLPATDYPSANTWATGSIEAGASGWRLPAREDIDKMCQTNSGAGNGIPSIKPSGFSSFNSLLADGIAIGGGTSINNTYSYWTSTSSGGNNYCLYTIDATGKATYTTGASNSPAYARAVKTLCLITIL